MEQAQALNIRTGELRTVTGRQRSIEMGEALKNDAPLPEEHFFARKCGDPLIFKRLGKPSAHWARVRGYGTDNETRGCRKRQGRAAFKSGTKTLLMLDNIFGYKERPYSFDHITASKKAWPLDQWIFANRADFNPVPVPSLTVAIDEIRKLSANLQGSGRQVHDMCFAQYGGAVLPYSQFFLNSGDTAKLIEVDKDLRARKNVLKVRNDGDMSLEPNRCIGLPRIFHFSVTDTTKRENGERGLKGNRIVVPGRSEATLITALRPARASVRQSAAFEAVRKLVIQGNDVYVLATPRIPIDPEDLSPDEIAQTSSALLEGEHSWNVVGLNINNAARQIVPVGAASGSAAPLIS